MAKPLVLASLEDAERSRCVDIFAREDGTFGFEEYRRDAEDQGRWTKTGYYGDRAFPTRAAAEAAARVAVAWLRA